MTRRLPSAVLALVAFAALAAGCGNKEEDRLEGHTEGVYLSPGPLTYQVQISRQLNPADPQDQAYLRGIPAGQRTLTGEETWFAVFLRVENQTEEAHPVARPDDIHIVDTDEREYRPIELDPEQNQYVYEAEVLQPGTTRPVPDSSAFFNAPGGNLLLYKLERSSLENRPLEFVIESPEVPQQEAHVDLDV